MSVALDTLRFTQRLEQVGVPREQAMAHAELARDMVVADVATKDDLDTLGLALRGDISALKRDVDGSLRELELRMTIKLGAIIAAAVAIVAALQRFF